MNDKARQYSLDLGDTAATGIEEHLPRRLWHSNIADRRRIGQKAGPLICVGRGHGGRRPSLGEKGRVFRGDKMLRAGQIDGQDGCQSGKAELILQLLIQHEILTEGMQTHRDNEVYTKLDSGELPVPSGRGKWNRRDQVV